jgi:hypothetical protein
VEVKPEIKVEAKPVIKVPEPDPVPVKKPKKEIEVSNFVARWEELPVKALRRVLLFGVANEGAVPFLVRASRVSKAWNEQAKDLKLWTHLDFSAGRLKEKYRNDKKLETLLNKFPNVLEVKVSGWKNSVGASTLRILSQCCPNLLSLGLASCFKLSNEDLKFIGDNFKNLERIDLSNVSVS